jgi:hypothetical protein
LAESQFLLQHRKVIYISNLVPSPFSFRSADIFHRITINMLFKSFILVTVASVLPVQANYFKQYYFGDCTGTVNDYHETAGSSFPPRLLSG